MMPDELRKFLNRIDCWIPSNSPIKAELRAVIERYTSPRMGLSAEIVEKESENEKPVDSSGSTEV